MRLHRFKSRQRVTIRLAAAMVVLLVIGAWITAQAVRSELSSRIDDQLRADAEEITTVVELLGETTLEDVAAEYDFAGGEWALIVVQPDGEATSLGTDNDPESMPDLLDTPIAELRGRAGEPFTVDDGAGGEDEFRVMSVPLRDGGVAVAARSLDSIEAVLRILHKTFAIAVVASIAALIALIWVISRQALKPLEDVVETAHAIGAGNLAARVDVHSTAPDVEHLADALNLMLARLQVSFDNKERSEARLRQFVSDASHELRTPLATILGYAELYDEHMARSPEQVDAAMRQITAAGTRMRSLVEDLLLLARLDEGRPMTRDAVDVECLVDDAVAAVRAIDGDRDYRTDTEPVEVIGDELALRQVLDNLLTNAATHTPPGTTVRVTVRPGQPSDDGDDRDDGETAVISVADDGPGMIADDANYAFDRFFRAERARARPGGAGLGLSIVAELVTAHGGTISLDTAPGRGATFIITLPRSGDSRATDGHAESTARQESFGAVT